MEDNYNFAEGENVLAYFKNLLYEAKCMKRRTTNDQEKQYFIHYKGWKTTWDEWVDEDELLEINDINLGHQQRLKKKFDNSKQELEKSKRGKKKIEKTSLPSPFKSRGRPKKTVIVSEKNKKLQTDKNLQKRGQSEKTANKPKSNIDDKEVKNKIKPVSNDAITEITPSSSTMGNSNPEMDIAKILREQSIRAAAHTRLSIIPFPMRLRDKLPDGLKLSEKIKKMMIYDLEINNQCNKLPKFHDEHYVANVAHTFIESHNFPDDLKEPATILCIKLMNFFNSIVHSYIVYPEEINNGIQLKGLNHFKERLAERPNMTYVYKQNIEPKKIWCYVYGPIFLLRFFVRLPFFVLKSSWDPQCNLDFFIQFINKMLQFLDDNIDTYFSADDYMEL